MRLHIHCLTLTFIVGSLIPSAVATRAATGGASTDTTRPNVLWIGVDQLRYDTPGYSGNNICKTPNLDALSKRGVNFARAYTTCSLCTPARASMLTGRFAFTHGMGTNCDLYHALARELPDPSMLLHRRLQKRGYRCGLVGKWHVGTELSAVDYGFEGMDLPGYGDIKNYPGYLQYLAKNNLKFSAVKEPIFGNFKNKTLLAGKWDGPVESTPTYYVATEAINLLEKYAAGNQPFMLDCQFWGPHSPHLPAGRFIGMHDRSLIEPWVNFRDDYKKKPARITRFRSSFYRNLPDNWASWQEIVGLYYDFTAMVDDQIGRILDRLDELGLSKNTIVVFESDHGDMTGTHGGLFDKGFIYEEAHRIPMIIAWPEQFKGDRTSDAFVYNMDIFPTLLDILGQPDESLDGISLLPILQGKRFAKDRDAIYLEFHGLRCLYSQRALVTKDGYKYIFNPSDFDEVYDLNTDPGELNNLIDSANHAAKINELRERIKIAAHKAHDPIADYVSKLFGDWEKLSGQFEAAAFVPGQEKTDK